MPSTNTDGYDPETDSSKDTFPGYLPDKYFGESDVESVPEWDDCNSGDEFCFEPGHDKHVRVMNSLDRIGLQEAEGGTEQYNFRIQPFAQMYPELVDIMPNERYEDGDMTRAQRAMLISMRLDYDGLNAEMSERVASLEALKNDGHVDDPLTGENIDSEISRINYSSQLQYNPGRRRQRLRNNYVNYEGEGNHLFGARSNDKTLGSYTGYEGDGREAELIDSLFNGQMEEHEGSLLVDWLQGYDLDFDVTDGKNLDEENYDLLVETFTNDILNLTATRYMRKYHENISGFKEYTEDELGDFVDSLTAEEKEDIVTEIRAAEMDMWANEQDQRNWDNMNYFEKGFNGSSFLSALGYFLAPVTFGMSLGLNVIDLAVNPVGAANTAMLLMGQDPGVPADGLNMYEGFFVRHAEATKNWGDEGEYAKQWANAGPKLLAAAMDPAIGLKQLKQGINYILKPIAQHLPDELNEVAGWFIPTSAMDLGMEALSFIPAGKLLAMTGKTALRAAKGTVGAAKGAVKKGAGLALDLSKRVVDVSKISMGVQKEAITVAITAAKKAGLQGDVAVDYVLKHVDNVTSEANLTKIAQATFRGTDDMAADVAIDLSTQLPPPARLPRPGTAGSMPSLAKPKVTYKTPRLTQTQKNASMVTQTTDLPVTTVNTISADTSLLVRLPGNVADFINGRISDLIFDLGLDTFFNKENSALARLFGLDKLSDMFQKPRERTDAPPPPVPKPPPSGELEGHEFYDEYALSYEHLAEHNRKMSKASAATSEQTSDMPFYLLVGLAAAGTYYHKK